MCEAKKHGTTYAYKVYRCRCPEIVQYMRDLNTLRREMAPPRVPDEMAIARALDGYRVRLTWKERRIVVAEMTRRGMTARAIAEQLGVTARTVARHRTAVRVAA